MISTPIDHITLFGTGTVLLLMWSKRALKCGLGGPVEPYAGTTKLANSVRLARDLRPRGRHVLG